MVGFLVEPFLANVEPALRPALSGFSDLEQRLVAMVGAARAEWPDVFVPPEVFVAYVATRMATDRSADEALATAHPADLYLACACVRGDAAAIEAFDRRFVSEIGVALGRMRLSAAAVDEIKQLVRQKLFVAEAGSTGKIADYSGRSGLRRWVRAVAVRTGLNFLRKGKRELLVDDDKVLAGVSSGDDDPEVTYMKQKYRNEFREAFQEALAGLSTKQRACLVLHELEDLPFADVAREVGCAEATARVHHHRAKQRMRDMLAYRADEMGGQQA